MFIGPQVIFSLYLLIKGIKCTVLIDKIYITSKTSKLSLCAVYSGF